MSAGETKPTTVIVLSIAVWPMALFHLNFDIQIILIIIKVRCPLSIIMIESTKGTHTEN